MKYVIYDIETLKNLFTACFLELETGNKKQFVIYDDINEAIELVKFLKRLHKHEYTLVGFNCINFDGQIIQHILSLSENPYFDWTNVDEFIKVIYNKAQELINLPVEKKFEYLIPEWKFTIPNIDLFKQKHYDGKAKMGTSLKWLQFTMRFPNIEEMPFHHDELINKDDVDKILSYNWNDVESTAEFFRRNKFETELRENLSNKYSLPLLNASEPRISKLIFGKFLSQEMNIPFSELKEMKTFRKDINLSRLIFPYISFKTDELSNVLSEVKKVSISPSEKTKFELCFRYAGIDSYFGLGGLHGCCESGVYESRENYVIHDLDVVSFYPNLAIQNNIKPYHLGESFNKIYKKIFEERQTIPKSDPINYVYKIILNSTYGLSKEINSYLYDPLFTYSITINGQLTLLMLIEKLVGNVPNLKIYQENTDGITIGYDEQYKEIVEKCCQWFTKKTNQTLEHNFYKKLIIRDVNNYIGVKEDFNWEEYQKFILKGDRKKYDKIKHKGVFELELDYHKNPSFLIIPLACEAYFVGGLDYKAFIRENTNIYNFLGAVKRKANFELNIYSIINGNVVIEKQQKVTRFYPSLKGGLLMKDFTDGRKVSKTSVLSKQNVTSLNKIINPDISLYDIDYEYFYKETEKLISTIEQNKTQLSLF